MEGGGAEDPPGRDPITGPLGVVLCGVLGAVVVGLGVDVGCGWVGTGSFDRPGVLAVLAVVAEGAEEACESLMEPSLGRSPCAGSLCDPCSSGAPLGRSVAPGPPPLLAFDDTTALFVNCPGGWLTGLLQAAQTRAAATAVAAALAGATVPRIGMDATVAK
jgi:hypothetical protein